MHSNVHPHDFSRRTLLRSGLAVAAAGALGTAASTPAHAVTRRAAAPFVPYTAGSFFTSPVAGAPPNAARTTEFRRFMVAHPEQAGTAYPKINGLDGNKWGTAWAMGVASDPVWKLTGGNIPKVAADLRTLGFHAPEWFGTMFSGTNDSPFVCLDTGSGQSVWAANAKVVGPHTISVSSAGRFKHATNGLDRRNPRSNGPQNERSRGAIPDAMAIRRDLVDAGIANGTGLGHVLHMFLVETDYRAAPNGACHPMVKGESKHVGGFGAEGERIAIAPSVNLAARGLSPAGLVVARTLQQHGCYIGDNSGSTTALKAEQASSGRDPWSGLLRQDSLRGLTWDDFVVLPMGWQ